ncbi:hypothetical protein [Bradyrhizobium sp. DASA03120]|uniref:hypothetical protein n=1 Tax=Bradyrhizobium sp. SMVTL-02 TaxID=3395917 RepID=UPI003F72013C
MLSELNGKFAVTDPQLVTIANYDRLLENLIERKTQKVDLSVASVMVPERNVEEGTLIKAASIVWTSVLEELERMIGKTRTTFPRASGKRLLPALSSRLVSTRLF